MKIFILKNQSGNNLVYLLGFPIPSAIYKFYDDQIKMYQSNENMSDFPFLSFTTFQSDVYENVSTHVGL